MLKRNVEENQLKLMRPLLAGYLVVWASSELLQSWG